jgi:hypothetical protein
MTPAKPANHCCKYAFRVLLEILNQRADRGGAFASCRMTVTRQHPTPSEDDRRVVPFRSRGARTSGGTQHRPQPSASPDETLAKYEGGEEREDAYRHRMMVNLAAFAFIIVLALAGVWLAIEIIQMRKNQDCILSGRRNCAPIDLTAPER